MMDNRKLMEQYNKAMEAQRDEEKLHPLAEFSTSELKAEIRRRKAEGGRK